MQLTSFTRVRRMENIEKHISGRIIEDLKSCKIVSWILALIFQQRYNVSFSLRIVPTKNCIDEDFLKFLPTSNPCVERPCKIRARYPPHIAAVNNSSYGQYVQY